MINSRFIITRIASFRAAFKGLYIFFTNEVHAKIHLTIALLTCGFGLHFKITKGEWIAVSLSIALVIGLEMLNSSLEKLADFIHPERHNSIRDIKDLAAGAVLIASMAAAVVGVIIFLPKFVS